MTKKQYVKLSLTSILLSSLLTACGGEDSSNSTKPEPIEPTKSTLKIQVQDGYVKNAEVFVDLNKNNVKDEGEPTCTTNITGDCNLEIEDKYLSSKLEIIAQNGIDTDSNSTIEMLKTTMDRKIDTALNLTPVSTLICVLKDEQKVIDIFGIAKEDLYTDFIKNIDTKPEAYKTSFKIQKIMEALKKDNKDLEEIKTDFTAATNETTLFDIINNEAITKISKKIDKLDANILKKEELRKALAIVIREDIKNVADADKIEDKELTEEVLKKDAIKINLKKSKNDLSQKDLEILAEKLIKDDTKLSDINEKLVTDTLKDLPKITHNYILNNISLKEKIADINYTEEDNKIKAKESIIIDAMNYKNNLLVTLDNNILFLVNPTTGAITTKYYDYAKYKSFMGLTSYPKIKQIETDGDDLYLSINGSSRNKPSRGIYKIDLDDLDGSVKVPPKDRDIKKSFDKFKLSTDKIYLLLNNSLGTTAKNLTEGKDYTNFGKNLYDFTVYNNKMVYLKEADTRDFNKVYIKNLDDTGVETEILIKDNTSNGIDYFKADESNKNLFKIVDDHLYLASKEQICKSSDLTQENASIICKDIPSSLLGYKDISPDGKLLAVGKRNTYSQAKNPYFDQKTSELSTVDIYDISDFDNMKLKTSIFVNPLEDNTLVKFLDNDTLVFSSKQTFSTVKITDETLSDKEYFELLSKNIFKNVAKDLKDINFEVFKEISPMDKFVAYTQKATNIINAPESIHGIDITYTLSNEFKDEIDPITLQFLESRSNNSIIEPPFGIEQNETTKSKSGTLTITLKKGDLTETITKDITIKVNITINQK